MSDTVFINGTVVVPDWLNDVNQHVYHGKDFVNGTIINVRDFPYSAKGDGITDDTGAIQTALNAGLDIIIPAGTYKLTSKLTLVSNQTITMSGGTILKQSTINTEIFYALGQNNITLNCNGAILFGEGSWSGSWTGSGGHNDRGIHLINCTHTIVDSPYIKNCALAGIAMLGGNHNRIINPKIEGTNLYSTPIPPAANFQFCIYVRNDPVYGAVNDCTIVAPNLSGSATGFLFEQEVGAPQGTDPLQIIAPVVHDITGQHAFYMQCGLFNISSPTLTDINLSGIKVQAADANLDINDWAATDVVAKNLGSQMFEIAGISPFTGKIKNFRISGNGVNVGRAASFARNVENGFADLIVDTCPGEGVYVNGSNVKDLDIKFQGRSIGLDGILVDATSATGIKLRPTLRDCNTTATGTCCGIRVASVSANVDIYDPDVTDTGNKMLYGLFNSVAGSIVKVKGSAVFTGATDTAVRATGVISEWPTETTLSGTNGAFTNTSNIRSKNPFYMTARSTSASNVAIWQQTLDDESSYLVTVRMAGKLLDSSQRRGLIFSGVFYRDGGGVCTIQGAVDVDVDIASGSFTGAYSLQSNGSNDVVLLVNSGGASTYDWAANITVTKLP